MKIEVCIRILSEVRDVHGLVKVDASDTVLSHCDLDTICGIVRKEILRCWRASRAQGDLD